MSGYAKILVVTKDRQKYKLNLKKNAIVSSVLQKMVQRSHLDKNIIIQEVKFTDCFNNQVNPNQILENISRKSDKSLQEIKIEDLRVKQQQNLRLNKQQTQNNDQKVFQKAEKDIKNNQVSSFESRSIIDMKQLPEKQANIQNTLEKNKQKVTLENYKEKGNKKYKDISDNLPNITEKDLSQILIQINNCIENTKTDFQVFIAKQNKALSQKNIKILVQIINNILMLKKNLTDKLKLEIQVEDEKRKQLQFSGLSLPNSFLSSIYYQPQYNIQDSSEFYVKQSSFIFCKLQDSKIEKIEMDNFLTQKIQQFTGKKIMRLESLIYGDPDINNYDMDKMKNISNFIVLIFNQGKIFGLFSQSCFEYHNQTNGFLFQLSNKRHFLLKKNKKLWRYSPYQLVIGENLLQIIKRDTLILKCNNNNKISKNFQSTVSNEQIFGKIPYSGTKQFAFEILQIEFNQEVNEL